MPFGLEPKPGPLDLDSLLMEIHEADMDIFTLDVTNRFR